MRLLILFLSLPWWLFFPMAGGVAWLAYDGQGGRSARAADIEAQIAAPPPQVENMVAEGMPTAAGPREVMLRAQVDTSLTTELVQRNNGIVTSRHLMYALVAAEASETPHAVQGLIIVPMSQQDALVEFLVTNTAGWGAVGPIVKLPGWVSTSNGKSSHALNALSDQGHTTAAGEFYLTPFLEGREAGLRAQAAKATQATLVLYLVAAGIAAIGLAKLVITRIGAAKGSRYTRLTPQQAQEVLTQPAAAPEPGVYAALTPEEEAALTPLQRIKRRQALEVAAPQPTHVPKKGPAGFGLRRAKSPMMKPAGDGGPIRSTRRRGRAMDPFDKLAEEAARI